MPVCQTGLWKRAQVGVEFIPCCLLLLPLVSKGNKKELRCSLECKYLNSDDYKDLLWTTLSEFPGTYWFHVSDKP